MINGVRIALLINPESIVRPEGIIIMKSLLLTIGIGDYGGVALHLHAELGPQLLLPLVKGTHPHPNFNTHINNKLAERRQLNSLRSITLILILMLQQMEHKRLASRVLNTLQFIRRGLNNEEEHESFNDLLIIARIVPKLPSPCLLQMLLCLKPLLDIPQTPHSTINLQPIYDLLSATPVDDLLLHDYLASSMHTYCTIPT